MSDQHSSSASPDIAMRPSTAQSDSQTLAVGEKIGYAMGDSAFVLFWHTWSTFLLIFYTDVFHLSAAAVGAMFGITRLFDAVNDPFMGIVADQTKSKYGRFRPWILRGLIPYMAFGVLLFTVPDWSPGAKLAYAYVTYIGASLAYTVVNIPYGALMGVMTTRSRERTALASYRFYGAYAAVIFVNLTLLRLVARLGGGDDAIGYQRTMIIYALLSGALLIGVFLTTRERIQPPADQTADVKADLSLLLKNKPWLIVFAMGILSLLWGTMRNSATLYYMKYHLGADDAAISYFLTAGTVAVLGGVAATGLAERYLGGKKRAFILLTVGASLAACGFYFVPPRALASAYAIHIASQALTGPLMPLFWSMIAETADYSEWKFGRRSTGLVFSAGTFSQKSGGALGGAIAGVFLAWIGYEANAEQSQQTVQGIRAMMSYVPALLAAAAVAVACLYPITPDVAQRMETDLAARRKRESHEEPREN
ncbi:MAG: MFS transporter [Planctomycetales bacterium]|nr:MFS transporter [Planctomycetales bacterium]